MLQFGKFSSFLGMLLLGSAALFILPSGAQTCDVVREFQFKKAGDVGLPSYISAIGTPLNVSVNTLLPAVIVQVWFYAGTDRYLDWTLNSTVSVEVVPPLRIGGNSVEFSQGEAAFTSLVIQESNIPGTEYFIRFFTTFPGSATPVTLETGTIVFVSGGTKQVASLRFGNFGFFIRSLQSQTIPINSPQDVASGKKVYVPTFWIEAVDSLGYLAADATTVLSTMVLNISASEGLVQPSSIRFAGQPSVQVNFQFFPPLGSSSSTPTFTFSAVASGVPIHVQTGENTAIFASQRNTFMLFDSSASFFAYNNVGNTTAVLGVPMPPVVIRLYTSRLDSDATNTGLVVQATSDQGTLEGAEALFIQGVATFSELTFTGTPPRSAVIQFSAIGTIDVVNVLSSGAVSVASTAIKAKHLSFTSRSFIQSQQPAVLQYVSNAVTIPSIVVQLLDSAYQIDATANDFPLQLLTDPTDVQFVSASDATVMVTSGLAVWSNVKLSVPAAHPTFRLRVIDPAGIRNEIGSGVLAALADPYATVDSQIAGFLSCAAASSPCDFSLRFSPPTLDNLIFSDNQNFFTTISSRIPTIRIQIVDVFTLPLRPLSPHAVPRIIAYTGDDPLAETLLNTDPVPGSTDQSNYGVWSVNEYVFSCLRFSMQPQGLVRIKFRLTNSGNHIYQGIPELRTGFVTVTDGVLSSYGMSFAPGSLVSFPTAASSAVVNIALPSIIIHLTDSQSLFDDSNSDVTIAASSSSGRLVVDGSSEQVSKGVATFSTLRFAEVGTNPVLTFTAMASSYSVSGKSLVTGPIALTSIPIPAYELAFAPDVQINNNVTFEWQVFDFDTLMAYNAMPLRAQINVRDSAHQITSGVEVKILPVSQQATFTTGEQELAVDTACSCVNFTLSGMQLSPAFFGNDVYVEFRVTSSTSPLLLGRSLWVGIHIVNAPSGSVCTAGNQPPIVTAEFRTPLTYFQINMPNQVAQIAYLMGVPVSRVVVGNLRPTSGVDPSTLVTWTGTKVDIYFRNPDTGMTNRKSGAQLASEFVALRPGCETEKLQLELVYYKQDDNSCNANNFYSNLNVSNVCVSQGSDICACFASIENWGLICSAEPSLQTDLAAICHRINSCRDDAIQNVCDNILATPAASLVWLWALLGSLGGVALAVGFIWWKKLLWWKPKVTAHQTIDLQY